jgi:3',5'-cyclic AMP phosphodiesterase CpdA
MASILHISDTHFGTEQEPVVKALISVAHERHPDVLVFSGDVTQRARGAQFVAARRMCDALGIHKTLVLPGNHDIPLYNVLGRAVRPYAGFLEKFGPRLEPVLDLDDFLVIGVNTTRAARHKDGEVSLEQIDRVERQLRQARPSQLRVVVTHQPADVIREVDEPDRLHGAEAALQAWSAAGADLILGGHIHLPYVKDLFARSTPTPRRMWCVQAGTAVSHRVRHNTSNSVNLIHWEPHRRGEARTCTVERLDFDPEVGWFKMASTTHLALD